MMSFLTDVASAYEISGSGFAEAKTIGFFGMDLIIAFEINPPLDKPRKTSAVFIAVANGMSAACVAKSFLWVSRSFLFLVSRPLLSYMKMFSFLAPNARYSLVHEYAAAPAPTMTILILSIFFFAN